MSTIEECVSMYKQTNIFDFRQSSYKPWIWNRHTEPDITEEEFMECCDEWLSICPDFEIHFGPGWFVDENDGSRVWDPGWNYPYYTFNGFKEYYYNLIRHRVSRNGIDFNVFD